MNLVTGGTGLVGAHLIYHLLENDQAVRAVFRTEKSIEICRDIFNYYSNPGLFKKIEWVCGDILDTTFLVEAFSGIDDVYHAAAVVSFNSKDRERLLEVNIQGTSNMVNIALESGVRKFCYVSSIGAFGRAKRNEMVTESTRWENDLKPSSYSVSKFHAELEVWRAAEEGLNMVIVNPSTIIGSGNWHRGSAAIIDRVWRGLPYYTEGRNGYVDVLDVVECMIKLMKSDISNERFLLVGENLDYRDFLSKIALNLRKKPPSMKVGEKLAKIALVLEKVKSVFSSKAMMITSETVKIALDRQSYSNEKVVNRLGHQFRSMNETIERVCGNYLKDS